MFPNESRRRCISSWLLMVGSAVWKLPFATSSADAANSVSGLTFFLMVRRPKKYTTSMPIRMPVMAKPAAI